MRKLVFGIGVIAVAAFVLVVGALGFVSASAQADAQGPTGTPQPRNPLGGMRMWAYDDQSYGPMHEYMVKALADALGISTSEMSERLASGESLSAIAEDLGLSVGEFQQLFSQARQAAIESAQEAGVLSQEQAEWMLQLMAGAGRHGDCPMLDGDATPGARFGGMGMFGNRSGGWGDRQP